MDIFICTQEKDATSVLADVKAYFAQAFSDKAMDWKCRDAALSASLPVSEEEITRVFQALVKRYPKLYVEASYSYDVREDDRSAQWWGTAKIYSERENGETKIVSSSSTYWN